MQGFTRDFKVKGTTESLVLCGEYATSILPVGKSRCSEIDSEVFGGLKVLRTLLGMAVEYPELLL